MDNTASIKYRILATDQSKGAFDSFNRNMANTQRGFKQTMRGLKEFRTTIATVLAALGAATAWNAIGNAVDKNLVDKADKYKARWDYALDKWYNKFSRYITESAIGLTGLVDKANELAGVESGLEVNREAMGGYLTKAPGSTYSKGNQAQMSSFYKTPDTTQGVNRFGKTNSGFYTAPPPKMPDDDKWNFDLDIMQDLDEQVKLLKAQKEGMFGSAGAAQALIVKQQMLNEMIRAGHEPTQEEIVLMDERISMIKKLTDEMEALAQQKEAMIEINAIFKDSFVDFGMAMAEGGNFVKTLNKELKNLSNRLLEMSLNKVFEILFGDPSKNQPGLASDFIKNLFMPRRGGGPTMSGKSYIVGEDGPELMTEGGGGYITPAHGLGGAGGQGISVAIHNYGGADISTSGGSDGKSLEITVDNRMAKNTADPYSSTSRIMSQRGNKPQVKRR